MKNSKHLIYSEFKLHFYSNTRLILQLTHQRILLVIFFFICTISYFFWKELPVNLLLFCLTTTIKLNFFVHLSHKLVAEEDVRILMIGQLKIVTFFLLWMTTIKSIISLLPHLIRYAFVNRIHARESRVNFKLLSPFICYRCGKYDKNERWHQTSFPFTKMYGKTEEVPDLILNMEK